MRFAVVLNAGIALLAAGCGPDAQPIAIEPVPPAIEQRAPSAEPPKPAPPKPPPRKPAPPLPSRFPAVPKPDLVYRAVEFGADFHAGEQQAIRKYGEKLIEVNGTVGALFRNESTGRMYVSEPSSEHFTVECVFESLEPWKFALPGQTVKVQGRARGGILYPGLHLFDCSVYSVSGTGPDVKTAAELGKAHAADSAKLKAKYGGKYVIVTGEIEAIERFDNGTAIASLTKADSGTVVRAHFANEDDPRNRTLREGQRVRVLCKLSKSDDTCFLHNCHLLHEEK